MKIVHLSSSLRGGAGIAMMRQHRALLAGNVDSRALYGFGGPPATETESQLLPYPDSFGVRLARKIGMDLSRAARVERAIGHIDPHIEQFSHPFSRYRIEQHPWVREADVINLHWVSCFLDYARFFATVEKPIVWTLHDQNPYLGGFHYEWERDRFPEMTGLEGKFLEVKKAALGGRPVHVVGNSHWNTERARQSGFFSPGGMFETVYYPLDPGEYHSLPMPVARAALGIPAESKVIGFACYDLGTKRKGFDFLIHVLPELKGRLGKSLQLLTFGQEPGPEIRRQLGVTWKHLSSISLPDFQRIAYAAMDLFLVPSRAEAFGQTAIEAQACGTRVIASKVGGLTEAIVDGRTGSLCPPDDASAWLNEIADALERKVGDQDISEVIKRHAPVEIAKQYQQVYERALS
jgi:glycosyltransferase involved in cell wall biosynthesis